ncbi:Na/Pi cotransporter family protein [Alsobacter sp. SYSU M60028]|uniref:Na/Pi cotransporter family protein n=1 Tax=Alsobacter ponti TaxID=2962936 RepID=A0ABT1LH96_9HYPH|nr:Na/Pi cotransporter family protein [Alsobacter ponti]MCP8940809.1 Na/Pi cotransporter family protein [Alsobacter ponti]
MVHSGATVLTVTLIGSVALLIWGVRQVRLGVTRAFGAELRRLLAAASANRLMAFTAGGFISGLMQSSTATALLLGALAGRDLLTLPVALVMMLGADVGSTLAAQLFAFDIKWIWALLIAAGVFVAQSTEADKPRGLARIAIGLGVMLLALKEIGDAAAALRGSEVFRIVLGGLEGEPLMGVAIMAIVTWLSHSSLAMVLFIMSLVASGAIGAPLALAFVLGANIGGAFAPLVSLSGSPPAARRVPLGNLLMRFAVALPLLAVLGPLEQLVSEWAFFSPGRLVVVAHTAFNVLVALLFLPFTGLVARLCERMIPDAPADGSAPRHLDPNLLGSPSEALACAMREALEMGNQVAAMLRRVLDALESSDLRVARDIERMDDRVDTQFEAIKLYLVQITRAEMRDDESRRAVEILSFTTNLEHIGDIIDKNLMELVGKKVRKGMAFSPEGQEELRRFHALVLDTMALALNAFASRDPQLARRLVEDKVTIRTAERETLERHYARLRAGRVESMESSAVHLDFIRDLKRIHGHLAATAYPILEAIGELGESRLRQRDDEGAAEPLNPRPAAR